MSALYGRVGARAAARRRAPVPSLSSVVCVVDPDLGDWCVVRQPRPVRSARALGPRESRRLCVCWVRVRSSVYVYHARRLQSAAVGDR